ncbi:hypothetical protein DNU06_10520 [Putridiphycobacter roseus]|uniref:Uncharacterized protein n=1 Tax=Putridiphycobacter roseus TaxID=2219161 RepID=A0A2W1NGQ7_9FLAO|nr:hypothetical protein [Putridiphycobacter roseus]PZE17166.1 hypothetical protein DNU06_10520 [Putridiphycobacter roseus]
MFASRLKKTTLLIVAGITLFTACKKDEVEAEEVIAYAMTLKINDVLYEFNNTFGTNEASTTTIYSYYPEEEYILLQGKNTAFDGITIQMWLKRSDLVVGTYVVSAKTDGEDTHVDLIDNTNDESSFILENTISGTINISFVDTEVKRVKGTFEFKTSEGDASTDPVNYTITDGTFDYVYDVE